MGVGNVPRPDAKRRQASPPLGSRRGPLRAAPVGQARMHCASAAYRNDPTCIRVLLRFLVFSGVHPAFSLNMTTRSGALYQNPDPQEPTPNGGRFKSSN